MPASRQSFARSGPAEVDANAREGTIRKVDDPRPSRATDVFTHAGETRRKPADSIIGWALTT